MRKGGFHNTESGLNSAKSNELFFFFWTGELLLVMCVLLLQCACLPKDKILFLSFSEETKDLIFPLLLNDEWSSFRSLSYSEQELTCAIRETDFPISLSFQQDSTAATFLDDGEAQKMKPSASSSGDNNSYLFSLFFLLVFHSVKGQVSKRDLDSVWVSGFVQGLKLHF